MGRKRKTHLGTPHGALAHPWCAHPTPTSRETGLAPSLLLALLGLTVPVSGAQQVSEVVRKPRPGS